MTDIKEGESEQYAVCPIDLSNLKSKVAEAIELCRGDADCLIRLNQALSEATGLCTEAISQLNSNTPTKN